MSHTKTPANMTTTSPAFNLPPLVQSYIDLRATQSRLRAQELEMREQVEHWIRTLPKQSIELEQGRKLKLTTVKRRVTTQAGVEKSVEQFVMQSSLAATAVEAKAFATQCAAFVWRQREVKHSHQLQHTTPRASTASRNLDAMLT
jgi:hypothetical protein